MADSEIHLCKIIHRLLYFALIEIRAEHTQPPNSKIFVLSDLFHTIPLQLEQALNGELSYAEIMANLQARAERLGCEAWLLNAISNATHRL